MGSITSPLLTLSQYAPPVQLQTRQNMLRLGFHLPVAIINLNLKLLCQHFFSPNNSVMLQHKLFILFHFSDEWFRTTV